MDGSLVFAKWRQCAPLSNVRFLDPPKSTLQTASRSVQPFLHSPQQKVPILYNGPPSLPPSKLPLCMGALDVLFGPTPLSIPNGISISSAVFLHSPQQSVPLLYNGLTLSPHCPSLGDLGPHLHGSMSQPVSTSQTASRSA